ncbi:hypothetical protein ACFE04_010476 [Oxalis oulophora]
MHYQAPPHHQSWNSYITQPQAVIASRSNVDPWEKIQRLASENAVVIFSISTCCMCHVVKRLFNGMGVNPTVYELDEDNSISGGGGEEMEKALMKLLTCTSSVPVVFIGGKLMGSMERVIASHINGTLVPLLKEAGALWL